MQSKSGQALREMTERQTWIQDKLVFLRSHIRRKLSAFKSQAQGASVSATTAHKIFSRTCPHCTSYLSSFGVVSNCVLAEITFSFDV